MFDPNTSLGDIGGGFSGPNLPAGWVENETIFSGSWFNTDTNDIGVFDVAMLTISSNANGTVRWRSISGADAEDHGIGAGSVGVPIINGMVGIPEPTSIALAGLGLVGLWGTRRRRSL